MLPVLWRVVTMCQPPDRVRVTGLGNITSLASLKVSSGQARTQYLTDNSVDTFWGRPCCAVRGAHLSDDVYVRIVLTESQSDHRRSTHFIELSFPDTVAVQEVAVYIDAARDGGIAFRRLQSSYCVCVANPLELSTVFRVPDIIAQDLFPWSSVCIE